MEVESLCRGLRAQVPSTRIAKPAKPVGPRDPIQEMYDTAGRLERKYKREHGG